MPYFKHCFLVLLSGNVVQTRLHDLIADLHVVTHSPHYFNFTIIHALINRIRSNRCKNGASP